MVHHKSEERIMRQATLDRTQRGTAATTWLGRGCSAALVLLGLSLLVIPGGTRGASSHPVGLAGTQALLPLPATCPIERIRVGDRVLAGNPEGSANEAEVDPATWRRIELVQRREGIDVDITLLRPLEWIQVMGAAPGATLELDMPELDIEGPARVLSVGPCPDIKPGAGRIVTGTFAHDSGSVLDLQLEGMAAPIGVTAKHRIYTEDRQAFVRAGELRDGETLRPISGIARVAAVTPRPGKHRVYNLEVASEHVYRVTEKGILVHNTYMPDYKIRGARLLDGLREATHADIVKALEGSGFSVTNHFIARVKDIRTYNLGMRTFKDLQTVFRKGTLSLNRIDPNTGHTIMQISHGRFNIIFDAITRRLMTIEPL
jgi:hypothetical protein